MLPSDGASGDLFGLSVAVSGTTALIGAYGGDDISVDSGSAYFFGLTAATGTETEATKLLPSDNEPYDRFGVSVAVRGVWP